MKFSLVDALVSLESGKSITMIKQVSLAEEYLADHFPDFPVLPGVMMLEAAVQAAAWLVRDFDVCLFCVPLTSGDFQDVKFQTPS